MAIVVALLVVKLLQTNISPGSEGTSFRCGGRFSDHYCKFAAEFHSDEILKIRQRLVKIWTEVSVCVFDLHCRMNMITVASCQ